jgi:D-xylose transport system permease protein
LISIASDFLPAPVGWGLAIVTAIVAIGFIVLRRGVRSRSGIDAGPLLPDVLRAAGAAVLSLGVAALLNSYLGVPILLVILLALTLVFAIISGSTVFGRHIYALGGNAEAARRAGIRVRSARIVIFTLASTLAAAGGILEASRAFSVSVNSGGGNTSLNAIAAAVIGGTSLFGGRGRLAGALLGALVISSVQNGLDLIGGSASSEAIATGVILLAAITIDVTARRRRLSRGTAGA